MDGEEGVRVFVFRADGGDVLTVRLGSGVGATTTVGDLQAALEAQHAIPVAAQVLLFRGAKLPAALPLRGNHGFSGEASAAVVAAPTGSPSSSLGPHAEALWHALLSPPGGGASDESRAGHAVSAAAAVGAAGSSGVSAGVSPEEGGLGASDCDDMVFLFVSGHQQQQQQPEDAGSRSRAGSLSAATATAAPLLVAPRGGDEGQDGEDELHASPLLQMLRTFERQFARDAQYAEELAAAAEARVDVCRTSARRAATMVQALGSAQPPTVATVDRRAEQWREFVAWFDSLRDRHAELLRTFSANLDELSRRHVAPAILALPDQAEAEAEAEVGAEEQQRQQRHNGAAGGGTTTTTTTTPRNRTTLAHWVPVAKMRDWARDCEQQRELLIAAVAREAPVVDRLVADVRAAAEETAADRAAGSEEQQQQQQQQQQQDAGAGAGADAGAGEEPAATEFAVRSGAGGGAAGPSPSSSSSSSSADRVGDDACGMMVGLVRLLALLREAEGIRQEVDSGAELFATDLALIREKLAAGEDGAAGDLLALGDQLSVKERRHSSWLDAVRGHDARLRELVGRAATLQRRVSQEQHRRLEAVWSASARAQELKQAMVLLVESVDQLNGAFYQLEYVQQMPAAYDATLAEVERRRLWSAAFRELLRTVNDRLRAAVKGERALRDHYRTTFGPFVPKNLCPPLWPHDVPSVELDVPQYLQALARDLALPAVSAAPLLPSRALRLSPQLIGPQRPLLELLDARAAAASASASASAEGDDRSDPAGAALHGSDAALHARASEIGVVFRTFLAVPGADGAVAQEQGSAPAAASSPPPMSSAALAGAESPLRRRVRELEREVARLSQGLHRSRVMREQDAVLAQSSRVEAVTATEGELARLREGAAEYQRRIANLESSLSRQREESARAVAAARQEAQQLGQEELSRAQAAVAAAQRTAELDATALRREVAELRSAAEAAEQASATQRSEVKAARAAGAAERDALAAERDAARGEAAERAAALAVAEREAGQLRQELAAERDTVARVREDALAREELAQTRAKEAASAAEAALAASRVDQVRAGETAAAQRDAALAAQRELEGQVETLTLSLRQAREAADAAAARQRTDKAELERKYVLAAERARVVEERRRRHLAAIRDLVRAAGPSAAATAAADAAAAAVGSSTLSVADSTTTTTATPSSPASTAAGGASSAAAATGMSASLAALRARITELVEGQQSGRAIAASQADEFQRLLREARTEAEAQQRRSPLQTSAFRADDVVLFLAAAVPGGGGATAADAGSSKAPRYAAFSTDPIAPRVYLHPDNIEANPVFAAAAKDRQPIAARIIEIEDHGATDPLHLGSAATPYATAYAFPWDPPPTVASAATTGRA